MLRLAALTAFAFTVAGSAHASPCTAGSDHLKPAQGNSETARQPLLKPYVLNGLAATAVQWRDGQWWLELAADSASTVLKAASRGGPAVAGHSVIEAAPSQVLLACSALHNTALATLDNSKRLAPALW